MVAPFIILGQKSRNTFISSIIYPLQEMLVLIQVCIAILRPLMSLKMPWRNKYAHKQG